MVIRSAVMILERLSILNYKNIAQADVSFSRKINCLFGNNGMGKTNFLDAVYYLSFCKSHISTPDSQIIRNGEEMCVLQGYYDYNGWTEDIFCAIRNKQKKQFKRNKKEYDKLSAHIGLLPLVIISPADTDLIQGGSEERRRFIDMIISQQNSNYLHALIQYNKALLQRNSLLKEQSNDFSLFEALEIQMVRYGELIHSYRKQMVDALMPIFDDYHKKICSSHDTVGLVYTSQLESAAFDDELRKNRMRDMVLGYTSTGIHKDDIIMSLGNSLIRRVGSQGQRKTYLIALKLAQFSILSGEGKTTPLLLLDDIFDKLDTHRVSQIIEIVSSEHFGQIFITDTNRQYLDDIIKNINHDYALFEVDGGMIREMERANG